MSTRSRRAWVASAAATAAAAATGAVWLGSRASRGARSYEEIARWQLPGGGEGRFIALPGAVSAEALKALGERLREESQSAPNAVVMIFDDADAARDVRRGSRVIGQERFQVALERQRAMYVKQADRGEHRLVLYARYPSVVLEEIEYPPAR